MERLTFDGNFCDIAQCQEFPCKYTDTGCSQRQVWERLRAIEDILGDSYDLEELRQIMGYRSLIGKTVYCIRRKAPKKNGLYGKTRACDYQISSPHQLKIDPEELCVAEKKCVKSDLNRLGVLVFLTREDAEAAIGGGRG